MADHTLTLDTAGLKYIDKDMIEHVINTDETLKLSFTDTGDGGNFIGQVGAGKITCTDGFEFIVEADGRFEFKSSADASATKENGEICFVEEGNVRHPWKVISLEMTDADSVGADNIVSIVLESLLHGRQITWTNINTA